MTRRGRHIILVLITGVLLGTLTAVLLIRHQLLHPAAPPSASAAPTEQSGPGPGPAEIPVPSPEDRSEPTPEIAPLPTAEPEAGAVIAPGPGAAAAAQTTGTERSAEVSQYVARFAGEHSGNWSLCFADLSGGEPAIRGGEEGPMVSASLIKLPIMGAVYEAVAAGSLDPAQCENWLGPMITVSDNGSANSLVLLLGGGDADKGMAAVNDWCLRQGLTDTRQNRLMLVDNGLQNYTGAADCARLLAAIYRGDCVSPEASRQMLSLLLQQQVNDRLPLGLPEGTPIAHKTGDLIGLCWADVGIVYSPGGDYVLCVISDGQASEREAKSATAALSREVYALMNPET